MKKSIYAAGVFTLALAMSGLPAVVRAESGSSEGQGGVGSQEVVTVQGAEVPTGVSVRAGEKDQSSLGQKRGESKEQDEQVEAVSLNDQSDNEEMSDDQNKEDQDEIDFELEDDEDIAVSLGDLKQKIENRKHELKDEEASTTPKFKDVMKNANEVRLAVHALLSSKHLLGGIGEQVSEIAKHMNDSVSTTTNAEAQIESRNFFARLFFGGDAVAADVISQEVAQNQQRIDVLTNLLGAVNISADIKVTIQAQIVALQDAQTRLHDLAQREQGLWGLFSWRF